MAASDSPAPGSAESGTPSEASEPRRWNFRLRIHIATLFLVLIAAAGLAIVGYG